MGNNFTINKSGMSLLEIEKKFQFSHSIPITIAESTKSFEASYKEPEFRTGEDGHLQGGDFEAMKIFNAKFAKVQEDKQISLANASVSISEVANASTSSFETDPTCFQC